MGNMLLPPGVEQDPHIRFAIMTSPCEARGWASFVSETEVSGLSVKVYIFKVWGPTDPQP